MIGNHPKTGPNKSRFIVLVAISTLTVISCQPALDRTKVDRAAVGRVGDAGISTAVQELKFENAEVSRRTNIHYTGLYCNECHETPAVPGGEHYLRFEGDYGILCRCHVQSSEVYIHPVNIKPTLEKKKRMPSNFPLEGGKVTCLTCHDIFRQCQKRLFERHSLRGAPYPRREDFCYSCHPRGNYAREDPHLQINDNNEILIATCLICHKEKPDEAHATFKDVTLIGDIEAICRRCHHIAGNHSGNVDHMGIIPSPEGLEKIKQVEAMFNTRLPLNENGKMTCITCHNPHAKGVLPESNPGATGAGSKYRHRLPEHLCLECHQM